MASGYTVFVTYLLKPAIIGGGYSPAIHCNYFSELILNSSIPDIEEVRIIFPDKDDFKFLSTSVAAGTGFTANYLYALVQLISGTTNVKPIASNWKIVDLTTQMTGHTGPNYGTLISPADLVNQVFKVSLNGYGGFTTYDINNTITGLNYPTSGSTKLCFGDEIYFLGNVSTDIHADVFTTTLNLIMNLGEFNSSTNSTWNGQSVFATEVGIYDGDNNLVAIGKFNDPVEKNASKSRTVLFALDF